MTLLFSSQRLLGRKKCVRSGRKIESTDSTHLTGGLKSRMADHSDISIREWKRRRNGIWGLVGEKKTSQRFTDQWMGKGLSIDFARGSIVAYGNKVENFFSLFLVCDDKDDLLWVLWDEVSDSLSLEIRAWGLALSNKKRCLVCWTMYWIEERVSAVRSDKIGRSSSQKAPFEQDFSFCMALNKSIVICSDGENNGTKFVKREHSKMIFTRTWGQR